MSPPADGLLRVVGIIAFPILCLVGLISVCFPSRKYKQSLEMGKTQMRRERRSRRHRWRVAEMAARASTGCSWLSPPSKNATLVSFLTEPIFKARASRAHARSVQHASTPRGPRRYNEPSPWSRQGLLRVPEQLVLWVPWVRYEDWTRTRSPGTRTAPDWPFAPASRPTSPLFSAPFHRGAPVKCACLVTLPSPPRARALTPWPVASPARRVGCSHSCQAPGPQVRAPPDWLVLGSHGQLARRRPESVAMTSGPVSPGPFPATASWLLKPQTQTAREHPLLPCPADCDWLPHPLCRPPCLRPRPQ